MSTPAFARMSEMPRASDTGSPPTYEPCADCGRKVLHATILMQGSEVIVLLDTDKTRQKTYCVTFGKGDKHPIAKESAAYPVHRCQESA